MNDWKQKIGNVVNRVTRRRTLSLTASSDMLVKYTLLGFPVINLLHVCRFWTLLFGVKLKKNN